MDIDPSDSTAAVTRATDHTPRARMILAESFIVLAADGTATCRLQAIDIRRRMTVDYLEPSPGWNVPIVTDVGPRETSA